jgi:hypothetical protein
MARDDACRAALGPAVGPAGVQLAVTSGLAIALSAIAVLAIALLVGPGEIERVFRHLHPAWIALCTAGSLLVYPTYTLAYLALVSATGVRATKTGPALRTVLAGFGPFSIGGGFRIDLQALRVLDRDEHVARVQVLAFGPTARVAPVARAWTELAGKMADAGATTVAELACETIAELAGRPSADRDAFAAVAQRREQASRRRKAVGERPQRGQRPQRGRYHSHHRSRTTVRCRLRTVA